jgi:hypothetical protein
MSSDSPMPARMPLSSPSASTSVSVTAHCAASLRCPRHMSRTSCVETSCTAADKMNAASTVWGSSWKTGVRAAVATSMMAEVNRMAAGVTAPACDCTTDRVKEPHTGWAENTEPTTDATPSAASSVSAWMATRSSAVAAAALAPLASTTSTAMVWM